MNSLFSFFLLLFLFQGLVADKHISTKFLNPSRVTQLSWHPRHLLYHSIYKLCIWFKRFKAIISRLVLTRLNSRWWFSGVWSEGFEVHRWWRAFVYGFRIFIYKGFLSDEECEHLIELGKDKLKPSMVTHSDSGKITFTKQRTSSSTFLHKHQVSYNPFFNVSLVSKKNLFCF